MSEDAAELPSSWKWSPLGDLGAWVGGGTPAKSTPEFWTGDIPWVSPKDMKSFEIHDTEDHITDDALAQSATSRVPAGTVLMVTRSGILRHTFPVAVSRRSVALNQDLKALTPHAGLHPDFIAYALHFFARHVLHSCAKGGTTVQSIESPALKRFAVPIAPSREQQRIADTLDEVLSDLDAGVGALRRVQEKLRVYRASVLKAAVEGALTAEWRAQHPKVEPARELVRRILAERRRRWEEDQLAKLRAKSQEPPKNWNAKYKEPIAPDAAALPPLPGGWCWISFGQITWNLRSGTAETSGRDETPYPVLKSSAVRHGSIDFTDLNYLQKAQSSRAENYVRRGDFLITRLSGSVDFVGCTAVVKDGLSGRVQYPDRIFCGKLVTLADGTFLSYCFRHHGVRTVLEAAAKSTAGHQRISMSDLSPLIVPMPPLPEQEAIVEIVEDQMSVIDHLEADIEAKLRSAQSLRQAILRHAFTGKLVPQDPNDEPASVMLERIAAEREARARDGATPKRSSRQVRQRVRP